MLKNKCCAQKNQKLIFSFVLCFLNIIVDNIYNISQCGITLTHVAMKNYLVKICNLQSFSLSNDATELAFFVEWLITSCQFVRYLVCLLLDNKLPRDCKYLLRRTKEPRASYRANRESRIAAHAAFLLSFRMWIYWCSIYRYCTSFA